jgi:hypothetical protein
VSETEEDSWTPEHGPKKNEKMEKMFVFLLQLIVFLVLLTHSLFHSLTQSLALDEAVRESVECASVSYEKPVTLSLCHSVYRV